MHCSGHRDPLHIEAFLAQDPFVQGTHRRARVDTQPSGTGAPSTVISRGPSTPNPILFSIIRGHCDPLAAVLV
jgi:hypothetical protein